MNVVTLRLSKMRSSYSRYLNIYKMASGHVPLAV